MNKHILIISIISILVLLYALYFFTKPQDDYEKYLIVDEYHIHSNISVVINDDVLDFSLDKYQSDENKNLHPFSHFHDGNGEIWHIHYKGENLIDFLNSVGIKVTDECIFVGEDRYCADDENILKLYVNNREKSSITREYVPADLDRILVYYGTDNKTSIDNYISMVSDTACIESAKCPERGEPSSESSCSSGSKENCPSTSAFNQN